MFAENPVVSYIVRTRRETERQITPTKKTTICGIIAVL